MTQGGDVKGGVPSRARNGEGEGAAGEVQHPDQPTWDLWQNRILTPQVNAIVKNTFVNVVGATDSEDAKSLRRSASDGDVSKSSGESQPEQMVGYFLPSLWSSSNSSDKARRDRGDNIRNFENAPWVMSHGVGAQNGGPQASPSANPWGSASNQNWRQLPPAQPSQPQQASYTGSTDDDRRPLGMMQGGPAAPSRLPEVIAADQYDPPPEGLIRRSAAGPAMDKDDASNPNDGDEADEGRIDERLANLDKATLVAQIYDEMKGRVKLEKLEEMANAGVLARIPRNSTDELSSVGSMHHLSGSCTPCAYW